MAYIHIPTEESTDREVLSIFQAITKAKERGEKEDDLVIMMHRSLALSIVEWLKRRKMLLRRPSQVLSTPKIYNVAIQVVAEVEGWRLLKKEDAALILLSAKGLV